MPRCEGKPEDRIETRYIPVLDRERPVLVLGAQFEQYLDSLEERHRVEILYGILLLRRLSVFDVSFIKNLPHIAGQYKAVGTATCCCPSMMRSQSLPFPHRYTDGRIRSIR